MFNKASKKTKVSVGLLTLILLLLYLSVGCKSENPPMDDPNIEDFKSLDSYFRPNSLNINFDKSLDSWERVYEISGSYDLDGDGEDDSISLTLYPDDYSGDGQGQSFIEVNDIKELVDVVMPVGEVHIIDLDTGDNFREVAILDAGSSADYVYLFYRYGGESLFKIGEIDELGLMDGKGSFISWFNYTNKFDPQFYSQWAEITDNEFIKHKHNLEEYIGLDYVVDGEGYFVELEENPKGEYHKLTDFSAQNIIEFKEDKFKLIDILGITEESRLLNYYYVEMDKGQKGLMYFWIGD